MTGSNQHSRVRGAAECTVQRLQNLDPLKLSPVELDALDYARTVLSLFEQLEASQAALDALNEGYKDQERQRAMWEHALFVLTHDPGTPPDSPYLIEAQELLATKGSNPASLRDEVRLIEGPLSPDEVEETVTRVLDSFGGSTSAANSAPSLQQRVDAVLALEGVVFASDPKERPMLAQGVVHRILRGEESSPMRAS